MRYSLLRFRIADSERARVVRNLVALREQLSQAIPPKDAEDNLLLATWNVRDLGKINRRGFGDRLPETYFYIAEVLSRFDFVAVQEVNELDEWERITEVLGPDWGWIATDVTDPKLGGNGERLTYLYDRRKVWFQNIAGEIVLPANLLITTHVAPENGDASDETVEVEKKEVGKQFRRTPFTAMFQSAWFKFDICTVHIYYGKESGSELKERIAEIDRIANYFGDRAKKAHEDGRSLILLGDFNIVGHDHDTMKALLGSGFQVPKALQALPTNIGRDKYYDQIAFRTRPGDLEYLESEQGDAGGRAGAFEIFKRLFTEDQFDDYKDAAAASPNGKKAKNDKDRKEYYMDWRTYQFSDHLPLWVRLKVNDSGKYLEGLLGS
jgi:endonuclease/exonuclease/phosphatase family metal-dependent hydrolase